MRRKLLIAAGTIVGLGLLLAIAVIVYVRSGRLDLLLKDQLVAALDDAGIRAEIGQARLDLAGNKVTLDDLRLFVKKNNEPLGTIDQVIANFSITSYLRQEFSLKDVQIVHPTFFLKIDETGRRSIDPLLTEGERRKKEKGPVSYLGANVSIEQGELQFTDDRDKATAHLSDLAVEFNPNNPLPLTDELNHRLKLTFSRGTASYHARPIDKIAATVEANITEKDARVEKLELTSSLGTISMSGAVAGFAPVRYETSSLRVEALADQVARVFAPDLSLTGKVVFNGKLSGTGSNYHATGAVESPSLAADGVRIASLRVKTNVEGNGPDYNAAAELASGAILAQGFQIGSASVTGAHVKGSGSDFDLNGALKLAALKGGVVTVNSLSGNLTADPDRVGLSNLTADALGGLISGQASVGINGGGSSVDLEFKSIDLDQAATLAAAKEVKVRGTASGTAQLKFPGRNYREATGRIAAHLDGSVAPGESDSTGTPAGGELVLIATGQGFKVERGTFHSANSTIDVDGQIGWNGNGAFDIRFRSEDLADVQTAVESFGLIPQDLKERYEAALSGPGSFEGHADVDLKNGRTDVTGHLRLTNVKLHEEELGSFEGDLNYSPARLQINGGLVTRPDGSRAEFDLAAALGEKPDVSIKARVQEFSLPAIVRAAAPDLSDFVGQGVVTGTIDLRGLPGPRTIEGTAQVTLSSAEFTFPSPDENEENSRVSVPQFNGDITFSNSVLTVNNLRMGVGESEIAGTGKFDLDTYAYSINAGGTNIDLAQVSDRISEGLKMSGRADVKVVGEGKWGDSDDWSGLKLNGTVEGRSVAINGRDLGDARLTAVTENGQLKIEATGRIAEQMRTVSASIDLRDRKNYPINASIEFTDTDIAPYLSWIAPELSGISGRATGSIKLTGPLQEPDNVQVVATFSRIELGGAITEGRRYTIVNQGDLVITGGPRGIVLDRAVFTGDGTSITLEGGLSREGSGHQSLSINGELNLRLLSSFTPIVFATGIAQVKASIAGTLESPQLQGLMDLKDVGVRIVDFPLSAAHGNGQIRFTSNQALIERFVATTPGGGSIRINGGAALAGLVPDRWRLEVNADQVGAEYPRDTQTVVDADLTLQGNRRLQVLSGNVEVRRASYTREVTLEELITSGGPFTPEFLEAGPGGSGAPSGIQTTLDIHIVADNTLLVKNNLADAVGSAYLTLRGSLDEPIPSGRVLLNRGTLEFRNGRWDLIRGFITIPGRRNADVVVDFQAEADIRGYHVTTTFSGEVSKLQVQVRSDPQLPEPEIISLVLTGSISSDRSTLASTSQTGLGLAQSILSASLSEQLERGTQRLFGLSRFSIDPLLVGRGNDPTARITIGQRVTRDLTVTYSQNLTSGSSGAEQVVLVEYRLSNRFSVVGYRNERGELGFDVRLRKRF